MIKQGHTELLDVRRRLRQEMIGPERLLWSKLRASQFHGWRFRRQHGIGSYIVDFYCAEKALVLEIDGETHTSKLQVNMDLRRQKYLESLGVVVVRYFNLDIMRNLEGMLEDLWQRILNAAAPLPPLLPPLAPPYKGGE